MAYMMVMNSQRVSEASKLSYVRVQSRFPIISEISIEHYAHAQEIIAKNGPSN